MKVIIKDCNNIDNGDVAIVENTLNLKYGINGTGKSTIAKAIKSQCTANTEVLASMMPYKYRESADEHAPSVTFDGLIENVWVFDSEYVSTYVFQADELVKGSYEIFVKTRDYQDQLRKVEAIVKVVSGTFSRDVELDMLIKDFDSLIGGFGKAKSGYAANGAIAKGIGKGNKIDNVPPELEAYVPYLQSQSNLSWLEWCLDGMQYRGISSACPFCTNPLDAVEGMLDKMKSTYDMKEVKNFNKMAEVFHRLERYFSPVTREKVNEILGNSGEISDSQKNYLVEIGREADALRALLGDLKYLSFETLKDEADIVERVRNLEIRLEYFPHFKSEELETKTKSLNDALAVILQAAANLKAEVGRQMSILRRVVGECKKKINEFLSLAGYRYEVDLVGQEDKTYKLMLRPAGMKTMLVSDPKSRLSYGERNALSLILFVFSALNSQAKLIVLDDPISSFDGNKKFAIVDMLFGKTKGLLRGCTVLMLTHDFTPVIDIMKTFYNKWGGINKPVAHYLSTNNGVLKETEIGPNDICSSVQLLKEMIGSCESPLLKLIYLRRKIEIEGNKSSLSYHMLSGLLHGREVPQVGTKEGDPLMTEDQKACAVGEIGKWIPGFDYDVLYRAVKNKAALEDMYNNAATNSEKLQIFRLMFNLKDAKLDDVVRKFCNETYHVENDYLFQLDPRKYDNVPAYVIDKLNAVISRNGRI